MAYELRTGAINPIGRKITWSITYKWTSNSGSKRYQCWAFLISHALTLESDWPFPTFLTVNTIMSTISQFHELLLISITWYQRALYNKFCDLIGYATRYLILDGRWVKWQGLIGSCILQPQSHCKTCDKPLVDLNKYCLPLWRKANARNVSFVTLNCGQFTFSTQLIKLNYPVLLIHLFRS